MLVSQDAAEEVAVWPENWPVFELFAFLRTQWRAAMAGQFGLDYTVLYQELDERGLQGEERRQMKDDIQVMEFAALAVMRSND